MKHIEAKGKESIANVSGKFFMIEDQCGQQNASLAIGTLQGRIVTCPLHFSRLMLQPDRRSLGRLRRRWDGWTNSPPVIPGLRKEESRDPGAD
jgi:hypothetical protein